MSGVVLSASVRQNLLSLQSTADLLATTQSRLASGKKVNSALDNPTNFFTAAGLDSRAGDINNLLDGISNGVQILQAANTGITSLQKLVDTAKSVANQALQSNVGYTKSSLTTPANPGANADNILGGTGIASGSIAGSVLSNNHTGAITPAINAGSIVNNNHLGAYQSVAVLGSALNSDNTTTTAQNGSTILSGTAGAGTNNLATPFIAADTIVVNGTTIGFNSGAGTTGSATAGTLSIDITTGDVDDVLAAINAISGGSSSISAGGAITLNTGTTSDLIISGNGLAKLGLAAGTTNRTNAAPTPTPITTATRLAGTATPTSNALPTALTTTDTITANGQTIAFFDSGAGGSAGSAANTTYLDLATATVQSVLTELDTITGSATGASTVTAGGQVNVSTGVGQDLVLGGTGLTALGLTGGTTTRTIAPSTPAPITAASKLSGPANPTSSALTTQFAAGDTLVINGKTISFNNGTGTVGSATAGTLSIDITTGTVNDILQAVDSITGGTGSVVSTAGIVTLQTGLAQDLTLGGNALAKLGLTTGTFQRTPATGGLSGQTLTIAATTPNTTATNITFGTNPGQVSTLAQLNAALLPNNLQAVISTTGAITITTSNDAASQTIGVIGGSATTTGNLFNGLSPSVPTPDPVSMSARALLVEQYNNIVNQITTTSQDASYNGINLLNGDTLKLVFNETGKSTLNVPGVTLSPEGLGLPVLQRGIDLLDNNSANALLGQLNAASTRLRSEASTLGSNLSIVQIRQNFAKNLINVLQTGSSNLTLADTNEEAANSQALSTRQSIAVSALALANQSQQSVLKLLQ
ncbi:flagellin [Tardiphaga alba]|uniref:Flagellin n=1 Tax=Tardiphaga alba TaxID=340268 RepID=A0ABX8ACF9_9BRAD|nr:flagellin [Tardiphaga alba]QUS40986.1 flagellin [Tardiphaga alba]